jgi:hypothetical protein
MHALALAMLGTLMLLAPCIHVSTAAAADSPAKIQLADDPAAGQLRVLIGDREALVYVYSTQYEMPHYYPVRSPSGKSMTVQQTEPYPHHRSFWFADRVRRAGQRHVNFYAALYTRGESGEASSPFNDRIRHVRFTRQHTGGNQATVEAELVWEMDRGQTPVLDEARRMRVVALGEGQYFVDVVFTLTAAHDAVTFTSDAVHYAWPFIRINQTFNVTHGGGTITNSTGGVNQHGTNMKEARWVDYSCTVDGVTEGLAMFSHPKNAHPHRWLTRDYGTFGPRREDARSGQAFTLDRGDSLTQRVGVLVHRGDAKQGEVARWYRQYAGGRL